MFTGPNGKVLSVNIRKWKIKLKLVTGDMLVVVSINLIGFALFFALISAGVFRELLFEAILLSASFAGIIFTLLSRVSKGSRIFLGCRLIIIGVLSFILVAQGTLLSIDRSRSLYILSWAHHHRIDVENDLIVLNRVKSLEARVPSAISQRIDEHVERGLMASNGEQILLTSRGEMYFKVADTLANIFQLNGWKQNKL
jgi:hypothetical protein